MSDISNIICPECGCKIPITDAISHQIEENLKKEFDKKSKDLELKTKELEEKNLEQKKSFEEKLKKELEAKENELKESSRKYLLEQREKLKADAILEAKSSLNLELEDLKKQNLEKENKLKEAREIELKFREEKRLLEQKEKDLELELIRRVDEERKKTTQKIEEDLSQKYKIQQLEYEKKISDMQKSLEDAKRRGEASSERFRGEIQELDLETSLRSNFIYDVIKEVPKGILGADVIQEVKDQMGRSCGAIIWESKRTKVFNEDWIVKLKDDLIRSKGKYAILITETLPQDIKTFGSRNGVWVTDYSSYLALVSVLRMSLIEAKRVEILSQGKDTKMSQVYNYLSSDDFRFKIQSIVETFIMMNQQIDQEKRAFQKQWSSREMQIKRIIESTSGLIGDLQGVMGNSLPKIEGFDMPGLGI